jgi:hypothetical protein
MLQSDCGFAGPCIDQCSGVVGAVKAALTPDAAFLSALTCDARPTVSASGALRVENPASGVGSAAQ